MIPLSHPLVQDYLTAARARPGDPAIPRIMLGDRLSELGQFPFIGEPGGLDLPMLCYWYATGRDEDEPGLRLALAVVDEWVYGNKERAGKVLSDAMVMAEYITTRLDITTRSALDARPFELQAFDHPLFSAAQTAYEFRLDGNVRLVYTIGNPVEIYEQHGQHGRYFRVRQRRPVIDIKRRVLALYPEINYRQEYCFSQLEAETTKLPVHDILKSAGFLEHIPFQSTTDKENRRIRCRQDFTAPQLIPPDAYTDWNRWRRYHSTPLDDFRAAYERILRDEGPLLREPSFLINPPVD